jgi:hypothetical protein
MSPRCAVEEYSCSRTGSRLFSGPVFLLAVNRGGAKVGALAYLEAKATIRGRGNPLNRSGAVDVISGARVFHQFLESFRPSTPITKLRCRHQSNIIPDEGMQRLALFDLDILSMLDQTNWAE